MTFDEARTRLTFADLLDQHSADVKKRIKSGRLSQRTLINYNAVRRGCDTVGLSNHIISELRPRHWSELFDHWSGILSPSTLGQYITCTKTIIKWGQSVGLIGDLKFGPDFRRPSITDIEAYRDKLRASRWIERDVILAVLNTCKLPVRLAVLLGINCGFYPVDTLSLTLDRLHMDSSPPYHDFRRVKTGCRRMAVLWPETVETIREYREACFRASPSEKRLLLTWMGTPPTVSGGVATLSSAFHLAVKRINGGCASGVGIGSLRHTYATVVDLVQDQSMIDLTMGHVGVGLQKRVYRQFNLRELARLEVVADTVREWLFYGKMEVT